jgi:hypothetical protein
MTRSRASSVAPTYTSAARSAMPRPWAAVVFAAVALAWAASRVRFFAVVRLRRPVDLLGAFVVALRLVERVLAARVVVLLRAVERRVAGLRAVLVPVVLVVFVVVLVAIRSAPLA